MAAIESKQEVCRNSFQQTLIGLEYDECSTTPADLFSRAVVEAYRTADTAQFSYLFSQVFEPGVLKEVALLEQVPFDQVNNLEHQATETITELADLVRNHEGLSMVALMNTAAALISISRFSEADRLLRRAAVIGSTPREIFEVAMLQFIISNRRDNGATSPRAFSRMRHCIETSSLPLDRILDACSQAVVWYLKRRELSEQDFGWFLAKGRDIARSPFYVAASALSSWYRALAMIPATEGKRVMTRQYMSRAREAALMTVSKQPRAYEMHLVKTYYESSLKEEMYLGGNLRSAEAAGRSLIDLDPAWSPSYGELAEAFMHFGEFAQAAELYETAARNGPPYVGQHTLSAANCHTRLGNRERALDQLLALLSISTSQTALRLSLKLAEEISHPACHELKAALNREATRSDVEERDSDGSALARTGQDWVGSRP
jgi:hypothetical protein